MGQHLCDSNSVCRDTPGSYECHCKLGYIGGLQPGILCININECEVRELNHCDEKRHNCIDTGSVSIDKDFCNFF